MATEECLCKKFLKQIDFKNQPECVVDLDLVDGGDSVTIETPQFDDDSHTTTTQLALFQCTKCGSYFVKPLYD